MSKKPKIKKPGWWAEFKAFAIKGNAMALAVGTIIGAAFSTITKSLTEHIIMPIVNMFLGGIEFTEMKIALPRMPWVEPTYETVVDAVTGAETQVVVENYLRYGDFLAAVINFLILAMVVFWLVKGLNKLSEVGKKKEEEAAAPAEPPAPPAPSNEEVLLAEIRDLLKQEKQ